MVGVPAAGEHGVQLLPGFLPSQQPYMVSAVTPWAEWMVVACRDRSRCGRSQQAAGRSAGCGGQPGYETTAAVDVGNGPAVPVFAVRRRRRSLVPVMITSPTLAWLPSANGTSDPAGE